MSRRNSEKYCIIEFDGSSKGNPGRAGAGAVLRTEDGQVISRVREGLGHATNNVAEYKGLHLGMRTALQKGYSNVTVKTDSQLVSKQVQGHWQTRNENMRDLCNEAIGLKNEFQSFKMDHVSRGFNSDADTQANLATKLGDDEVYYEHGDDY